MIRFEPSQSCMDVLLLITHAPWGLDMWEYDLSAGMFKHARGKVTELEGYGIKVSTRDSGVGIKGAWWCNIRPRLAQAARHLVTLDWSHPLVAGRLLARTPAYDLYHDVPLAAKPAAIRAAIIRNIARSIDALDPRYVVRDARTTNSNSYCHSDSFNSSCDWIRERESGARRVRVKTSMFVWDSVNLCWKLVFMAVILDEIDDLMIVVCAPWGLEFWEYHWGVRKGLSATGLFTETRGHVIQFYSSRGQHCVISCWEQILKPKLSKAALHVASFSWSHPLVCAFVPPSRVA